jgi:sodium-independent sulfate anion transporter 11
MTAIASMLETHEIIEIYKVKRVDFIPFAVTLICSLLLGLEFGILTGIAVNFLISIYRISRPKIIFDLEKINGIDVLTVTPNQSLNYSSAEYFKAVVIKAYLQGYSNAQIIFINGKFFNDSIDVTVVKVCIFFVCFLYQKLLLLFRIFHH